VRVVPSAEALDDIVRLREFLRPKSQRSAQRAVSVILKAIGSLSHAPQLGRQIPGKRYRELFARFGKGAYVVQYVVDDVRNEVIVLRIWHSRERRV
jgi:plasmid stabilization system protein ParE